MFYYEPRVGLAYDVFGTGKTVLRSGFAVFHYQVSTQVALRRTGPKVRLRITTAGTTTGYNQIESGGDRLHTSFQRRPKWVHRLWHSARGQQDTVDHELECHHFASASVAVGPGSFLRRQ